MPVINVPPGCGRTPKDHRHFERRSEVGGWVSLFDWSSGQHGEKAQGERMCKEATESDAGKDR